MIRPALVPIVLMALAAPAAAQNEAALKSAFEGRRVTLRMDMPGASDGWTSKPTRSAPSIWGSTGTISSATVPPSTPATPSS
jgi:hypothetical protein